jgi:glycosyltransferase involved in cell wall biosynthesis
LSPHKGVQTLLAAFRELDEPWRLLVAGDGPLAPEVAEAARVDDRIEWLGQVSGDAKDSFFDALDLVVIPSEWEEPATFVAVEAAVRGIPAVVSDRGGLPETPEARTFRAGDSDELVRAVRWFLLEPNRLEEASTRLLAEREEFEWPTHVARLEQLFEQVVAERTAH